MVYPKEYERKVKLADGAEVKLRPLRHSDAEHMLELFKHFSEHTIYYRFFENIKKMPKADLEGYLNVDYKKDIAIIAEKGGQFIGVARYMGYEQDTAEFAVVVRDDWHGRGVGTILMKHIIRAAKKNRFKRLFGIIMEDNAAMFAVLERLGLKLRKRPFEPGVVRVEFDI